MQEIDVSVYTLLWTGVIGVVLLVLRQVVLSLFSAKNQIVNSNAQDSTINRLQGEISRLERIINQQNTRIEELAEKLTRLTITEAEDSADIGILTIAIEELQLEVVETERWSLLSETVARMKNRRKARNREQLQNG